MKLEVGMHAYSKKCRDYGIGKIVNITEGGLGFKGDLIDIQYRHSKHAIENHDVIASFNIIDLIEEGDYINGHRVIFVNDTFTYASVNVETSGEATCEIIPKNNIKSIVTKEQFEQMSYKV